MAKSDYFLDYIESWATRLANRLYFQWRYAVSQNAWVTFLAAQAQDMEDAGQSLFSLPSIDDQEGANLDTIGDLIGQPRTVTDDATYRTYIKARIQANRSKGTAEELYEILRGLLGESIGLIYVGGGIKQFVIRVIGPITATQARAAVDFVGRGKEAGARGILEWQESATAALLILNSTTTAQCLNNGVLAGAKEA